MTKQFTHEAACSFCQEHAGQTALFTLCSKCSDGFCLSCEACKEQHEPEIARLRAEVDQLQKEKAEAVGVGLRLDAEMAVTKGQLEACRVRQSEINSRLARLGGSDIG